MTDMEPGLVFVFSIIALVVGTFAYKIVKHGGFKAAMFGSSIKRTVGEVEGSGSRMFRMKLRVHELGGSSDKAVGVELVAKSLASYQMLPISLSHQEAQKLIRLLQAASRSGGSV